MKSRKHNRLKKNPLVRFIRGVVRLLRVLFRPQNRQLRAIEQEQRHLRRVELEQELVLERQNIELEQQERARLITVGELLEQIKWQTPSETIIQAADLVAPAYDVSRN
ncbi:MULTISPECIES: hypothetical protein [unclassified Chamaesiphon]|uniref:hypothetical protein n=1 Tax=unclassified Chamaesiphon TaxID=2620921 RepID=UPI00286B1D31|nr:MULTISPECIES: hypothetical protein [unclassified Chamaesiphon]